MKTYIVQVGDGEPRELATPEEIQVHLIEVLTGHGWGEGAAESAARTAARRLSKGGRFAPDNRVTDVRPDGPWVRAWWEEAA